MFFGLLAAFLFASDNPLVSISEKDPTIVVEARYFSPHNFVGRPIRGYKAGKCYLTHMAADALAQVQMELRPFSLGLKVYDCYRPQKAVNEFIAWAKDDDDVKMKGEFYPALNKNVLFKLGYLAEKSGHSRGSTVDLTIIALPTPTQRPFRKGGRLFACTGPKNQRFPDNSIDMGTGYDCFDERAKTANLKVGGEALRNRLLLKTLMEKARFKNYEGEWWHYTLIGEPFPDTYFDFDVE